MNIPTFPVLRKTNNKGKFSIWRVEVVPEPGAAFAVRTTFGEEFGAQQTHTTVVTEGKAKRTPLQQATLLAQSKWNEKTQRDTYRPEPSVQADPSVQASPPVRPMLAQTYTNVVKVTQRGYVMPFPMLTQRKYDGIRCLSSWKHGEVVLESRKGVAFQLLDHLKAAVAATLTETHRHLVLDGELFTDKLTFETLSGLVRLTAAKAGAEAREKISHIEYHVYDVCDPTHPKMPFAERLALLERIVGSGTGTGAEKIRRVPTLTARTREEIKQQHDLFVQEGFEGIMLRDPSGPYEVDKRSKYLQKYKEFLEEEFRIVGFHDGEGIDAGLVTWDCVTASGRTFAAKPRGTQEQRRKWFAEAAQHVGKLLTVIFQEYSADGVPRFPIGKALRGDAIE